MLSDVLSIRLDMASMEFKTTVNSKWFDEIGNGDEYQIALEVIAHRYNVTPRQIIDNLANLIKEASNSESA